MTSPQPHPSRPRQFSGNSESGFLLRRRPGFWPTYFSGVLIVSFVAAVLLVGLAQIFPEEWRPVAGAVSAVAIGVCGVDVLVSTVAEHWARRRSGE